MKYKIILSGEFKVEAENEGHADYLAREFLKEVLPIKNRNLIDFIITEDDFINDEELLNNGDER